MCKDAGADLVGFFGLKRFEEFRAGMERVSFASKPNEGVVDLGLIYGPYVPQVRRESTKMLGPRDRLAGAKSVIVLGLHFPHAALDTAKVTPAETTGPFAFVQYETLFRLRDMAYEIARRLSAAGFHATFVDDLMGTASQVKNSRGMITDMRANGFAALLAGLAQIGVHGYPMSREFGVRQRFIAVVTDCPLPSDPLPEWQRNCKTCSRPCIRACPTAALAVGKDVLRLEGKSFPLPAVDGFACDWAKRYGLSGPEGPQYWGVDSDRPLPAERSAGKVAEAVSRVKWGIQKRHINIAEECLRVCPARGLVKR
jgi:ferredoxin